MAGKKKKRKKKPRRQDYLREHWRLYVREEIKFLTDFARMLDARIARLQTTTDPLDEFLQEDIDEHFERLTGLGFIACDVILTDVAERGLEPKILELGEMAPGAPSLHIAKIVHAAANYAKHHPEKHRKLNANVIAVLKALRVERGDSAVLRAMLTACADPPTFRNLADRIDTWRSEFLSNPPPDPRAPKTR
jgi:hypothetical protein